MTDSSIDKIKAIFEEQYIALNEQRVEDVLSLEDTKAQYFATLQTLNSLSEEEVAQWHDILAQQQAFEKVCVEVRNELKIQIKQSVKHHKAARAYNAQR